MGILHKQPTDQKINLCLYIRAKQEKQERSRKSYKGAHKVHLQQRVENAYEIQQKLARSYENVKELNRSVRARKKNKGA
jgi:hypothetical protein